MTRVGIKTVGCRLNQAETAQMAASLEAAGYEIDDFNAPNDVCIVHTCAVTRNAQQTCVRLARAAGRRDPRPLVVLAGCAVETDAERMQAACGADLAVGQDGKFRLAELIAKAGRQDAPEPVQERQPIPRFDTTRALVKVQDGCDFGCAYCIVPAARGAPRSIPARRILAQAASLAEAGYREIVLTGANLGCYADGATDLAGLLARVADIRGIERIRLSSIEMSTTERAVIDFMARCQKVCRTIHLPVQSGDDRILKAMGRRYSVDAYRAFVDYAVRRLGDFGLGTDVLVGFPGEDEKAFSNTAAVLNELPFSNLHVFPYSKRPGTRAARMPNPVPAAEKKRRAAVLAGIGKLKKEGFARRFVGRPVDVLVERVGPKGGTGWTSEYVAARIESSTAIPNTVVRFRPDRLEDGVLTGSRPS